LLENNSFLAHIILYFIGGIRLFKASMLYYVDILR